MGADLRDGKTIRLDEVPGEFWGGGDSKVDVGFL